MRLLRQGDRAKDIIELIRMLNLMNPRQKKLLITSITKNFSSHIKNNSSSVGVQLGKISD